MVDYHTDDDDGSWLRVDCGADIVHFAIGNECANEDEEESGAALDYDAVAALVAQLQSWLARTAADGKQ